jgi:phosphatidate cytidylyltransferase
MLNMLLQKSLLAIFSLLLLATTINGLLVCLKPEKNWRELTLRIRTWWIIIILFSLALISPHWLGLSFFALVSFMALKEYLTLVPARHTDRMPILWMFITIPVNYCLIGINWYGLFIIFIPVYMFLFLPARMVITGDTRHFLRTVSQLQWGLMTTVFTFSHVACLLVLPNNNQQTGALLVLFLVGLTEFNDITQYLWGKSLGKIKITPKVSPNKTLAGLLGGIGSTTIAAILLGPLLTPLHWGMSLLAGLIISISGFCGDIVMSAIKRDIGIKDSGTLLPGHGGILDRLDSLIFTAPVFFHFIRYFYY